MTLKVRLYKSIKKYFCDIKEMDSGKNMLADNVCAKAFSKVKLKDDVLTKNTFGAIISMHN